MDFRKMLRTAAEKVKTSNHSGSDQYIFNEIFGLQQYHRELIRLKNRTVLQRLSDGLKRVVGKYVPSIAEAHNVNHHAPEFVPGRRVEYGIGLVGRSLLRLISSLCYRTCRFECEH